MSSGFLVPNIFPKKFSFDVDIKSTNPKEFKMFLCITECVFFGSGWLKRSLCNFLCLPYPDLHNLMNGIIRVKSERQKGKSQIPFTPQYSVLFFKFPFHSFKSKVLLSVLSSCHTCFNYLTGLQRQGREWVSKRCHFSSSHGGHGDCCKWLGVTLLGISWRKAILRLQSSPFSDTWSWEILNPCWHCQCFFCAAKNWVKCWLISKF